jgi:hypothetical protein
MEQFNRCNMCGAELAATNTHPSIAKRLTSLIQEKASEFNIRVEATVY